MVEVDKSVFWDFINSYPRELHSNDYVYAGGSVYSIVDGTKEIARIVREGKKDDRYYLIREEK